MTLCTENSIRIDYVTESPNVSGDDRLLCLFLTLFASPFKSKSRLAAENAALRHQLIVLQRGCAVVSNSRTEIACSWSSCIDGFHRSSRPSRSSGPRPSSLASGRLPSVLAVEIPLPWRPAADRRRAARADPADERGKSAVGSAAHPWRAAQARLRGRSVQRREWDGPAVLPPPTTRRVCWGLLKSTRRTRHAQQSRHCNRAHDWYRYR